MRQRLHPLTPLLKGAKLVAFAAVAVSWRGLSDLGPLHWLLAMGAILVAAVLVSAVVWTVTGYEVVGRELRVHEGLISRRTRTIPLERVQAIDVVRPLLARIFGLAELRLEVIGAGKTEAPLAYLTVAGAATLRARLIGLSTGIPHTPAADTDVPATFTVVNRRLLRAQLLTPQALAVPVGIVFVAWQASLDPTWTLIGAASTITAFLGAFQVPVRRVLDEWDFTIGTDAAALRVRQGLLNKRSQTVPPRRIQGLKVTWPLLWRLPGWARARIDVAGYAGDGEQQLRAGTLVPVAASADTLVVAAAILGTAVHAAVTAPPLDAAALPVSGPPRRARWLAPLAWSRIGVAVTDAVVAVREGVLTRELVVVPLARVQSVRVVQGPLQRALDLATVHVDTAGGLHAVARHRAAAEAYALATDLATRSRTARRAAAPRLSLLKSPAAPLPDGTPAGRVTDQHPAPHPAQPPTPSTDRGAHEPPAGPVTDQHPAPHPAQPPTPSTDRGADGPPAAPRPGQVPGPSADRGADGPPTAPRPGQVPAAGHGQHPRPDTDR
ncbi:PH domain-containing protein [Dactylosporangium sp. NPDC005555]|uniref:PH domain-containing protein n=1 Tax=Dactylosporangium sp. NPDC005555 TaxID=3154889 RepID=UPI00339ED28B